MKRPCIPSRIAFTTASALKSRIILDANSEEKLIGKGDMLYAPVAGEKKRAGLYVSPEELEKVVSFLSRAG